ncbi:hypothetical protein CISIN_1g044443mg [Citrus sinensis]|uniref:Uncharacterized protein n=1 Tax=Citrus sinensis TaxID=2711 RepID=A0A067F0Q2_CITSI|nr:hypothetical protein CISIN_1g044443mg [Citrus sinensis]
MGFDLKSLFFLFFFFRGNLERESCMQNYFAFSEFPSSVVFLEGLSSIYCFLGSFSFCRFAAFSHKFFC